MIFQICDLFGRPYKVTEFSRRLKVFRRQFSGSVSIVGALTHPRLGIQLQRGPAIFFGVSIMQAVMQEVEQELTAPERHCNASE